MKKNKILLETCFWSADEIDNPFKLIEEFFNFCHIDKYKQSLSEIMCYTHKKKVYKSEYPGQIFIIYTALRSFIRSCYLLQFKSKKWKIKEVPENWSRINQSSLSGEEYQNLFSVFKNAFKEKSVEEYEFFLCEIVHISLSPYTEQFDHDIITPYIHLVKMLDAAHLLDERGVKKIKK